MSVSLKAIPDPSVRAARRPLRVALAWQVGCTLAAVVAAAVLAGLHGALSALLGGAICTVSFMVAGWLATRRPVDSAVSMLTSALWAELVRIGLLVVLLGATLLIYSELVVPAFLVSFIASVIILSLAVFVRDPIAANESHDPASSHGSV